MTSHACMRVSSGTPYGLRLAACMLGCFISPLLCLRQEVKVVKRSVVSGFNKSRVFIGSLGTDQLPVLPARNPQAHASSVNAGISFVPSKITSSNLSLMEVTTGIATKDMTRENAVVGSAAVAGNTVGVETQSFSRTPLPHQATEWSTLSLATMKSHWFVLALTLGVSVSMIFFCAYACRIRHGHATIDSVLQLCTRCCLEEGTRDEIASIVRAKYGVPKNHPVTKQFYKAYDSRTVQPHVRSLFNTLSHGEKYMTRSGIEILCAGLHGTMSTREVQKWVFEPWLNASLADYAPLLNELGSDVEIAEVTFVALLPIMISWNIVRSSFSVTGVVVGVGSKIAERSHTITVELGDGPEVAFTMQFTVPAYTRAELCNFDVDEDPP